MQKIQKTIRRRRREGKTDYRARFSLLKSDSSRLVVRRTNRYITAQVVQTDIAQDKVVIGVSSKDLLKYGWPKDKIGGLKNSGAAYLTGVLLAKKCDLKERIILDIGLQRNIRKGKLYAVVKGATESGLNIPYGEEAMPEEENLKKEGVDFELVNKIKEKINNG